MKTYVKPAMMALSISANDALCACENKPGDVMFEDMIMEQGLKDITNDGKVTKDDFAKGKYFASPEDSCGNDYLCPYTEYCKFTGSSSILFLS